MTNKEKFDRLLNEINWENWQKEDADCELIDEPFDITEVFYCKLQWIKEDLSLNKEEHLDTIEQIQTLLSLLDEEKIKRIL